MPFNSAQPFRQPLLSVVANGVPVSGALRAEVSANNHRAADRFTVDIALGPDPAASARFWASAIGIFVDVRASLDQGAAASLVQGNVDHVDLDPVTGRVRIEGRDLSAALIEARTQETFSNRTSSEIATLLAQRHGLAPLVTATRTLVGRYYQNQHDRITLDQFSHATTEWDLLVFLAQQEGFDVFVQGTTLFFQPPAPPSGAVPLTPADAIDLRLERSLTLARDLTVTVKSWNTLQQRAFVQTARAAASQAGSTGSPQSYVYVRPNLTTDQALQLAQRKLAELTRHERVVTATLPGDLTLSPRDVILLQGTGTEFDQAYIVDQLDRSLSVQGGFTQRLRATNVSARDQATTPADTVGSVTG